MESGWEVLMKVSGQYTGEAQTPGAEHRNEMNYRYGIQLQDY
jgi:hypothetical protein